MYIFTVLNNLNSTINGILMNQKGSLVLFILLIMYQNIIYSEPKVSCNYAYRYYSTRDGLAQMQVLCAYQDNDGYMWFGTKGGISRFDGISFKNYTSQNGFNEGNVQDIHSWDDKIVAMGRKLTIIYPNNKIEEFNFPDSLSSNGTRGNSLVLDKDRHIFFHFSIQNRPENSPRVAHYIFSLKSKKFTEYRPFPEEFVGLRGKWIVTQKAIYIPKGEKAIRIASLPYRCETIEYDEEQNDWYLRKYRTKQIERYKLINGKFNFDRLITKDQGGPFFVPLQNRNLLYIDSLNKCRFFPPRQTGLGVPFNIINQIFKDREENIWICSESGVYKYFDLQIEEYVLNISKPDNIWSIVEDNDKNMWFGSFGMGLWRMDKDKKLRNFIQNRPGANHQYMGSIKTKDGSLYFPTGSEVVRYYRGKFSFTQPSHAKLAIYYDEEKRMLLYGGINSETSKTCLYSEIGNVRKLHPWNKGHVICIAKDGRGRIRIGSFRGQATLVGDSLIVDTKNHPYEGIISMSTDKYGRLWKGTNKGVFVEYPDGKEYPVNPGKIFGMTGSIWVYKNKYLLVGGIRSLIICDIESYQPNKNTETIEIGYDAGFTGLESGQNGICEDSNGDIWMSTAISVMKFNPQKLVESQRRITPPIRLASVFYSKDNSNWKEQVPDGKTIYLSLNDKFIRIEYVANSISAPLSLRFRYRLKGFSEKWSKPIYKKYVEFTNLNYGNYQFEVQCSIDGEKWSAIARSPEIIVVRPLWATTFALVLYIILGLIVLIGTTIIILKERQRRKIQELNQQKLSNELQLKTLRAKIIPHFTGNVLSAIGYLSMTEKLKAGHYISVFSRFTRLTLANADKNYIAIEDEIRYIENYLELEKLRFEDRFEYTITLDKNLPMDFLIPTMTIHTYCDNAIRHGLTPQNKPGLLTIEALMEESELLIRISDNGVGRKKAAELGTQGNGQGLSLIEAQLKFYNNKNKNIIRQNIFDLKDSEGIACGTRIELRIPFDYKYDN